jgi:hypothetical protein
MQPRAISLDGNLLPPSLVGVMVLVDRSGSMSTIQQPMERAFAEFIAAQKAAQPDGMWVTVHQFDSEGYDVTYDRTPLDQVGALGLNPRSGTPLIDALYRFGSAARAIVDDANDQTQRLLLVIITDGGENQSRLHTWAQVRELMQGLSTTECESIWLGTTSAILEAQDQLQTFAQAGAAATYTASAQGVGYAATAMHVATRSLRAGGAPRRAMAHFTNALCEADVDASATLLDRVAAYDSKTETDAPTK